MGCKWFAGRCARILILFDAHKLDISDEMKKTIDTLEDNDNKIRVVLNKADIPTQELIRVYGALMWSLGKVVGTPEVMRVYVGSFWDKPLKNKENENLMNAEKASLMHDLRALPNHVAVGKVNEVIKRAKKVIIHAQICASVKAKMPAVSFGNKKKTAKICSELGQRFKEVMDTYNHPKMLGEKMPTIMAMQKNTGDESGGGIGGDGDDTFNPFANTEDGSWLSWLLGGNFYKKAEEDFRTFPKTNGKISGSDAVGIMQPFGLHQG